MLASALNIFKGYYAIMNYYSTVMLIHAHKILLLYEERLEFSLPVLIFAAAKAGH